MANLFGNKFLEKIAVKGAREHNLKNIDLEIPKNSLVVITGPSGSGKSSLAFDTLYAEGQRRYVESLSAYARQFLPQFKKPDVDWIEGLSPSIAIDQKTPSRNPRSTVGTTTEIYDYLRLLFARIGTPHCYSCGREIQKQTVQEMAERILSLPEGTKITLMAPTIRGKKGEFIRELENWRKEGFVRVRIDGEIYRLEEEIKLDRRRKHDVELIIDRFKIRENIRSRLVDSLELALKYGEGLVLVSIGDSGEEWLFSQHNACPHCNISYPPLEPRMFSFNSPYGACEKCDGIGYKFTIDPELLIPDPELSLSEGAIAAVGDVEYTWYGEILEKFLKLYGLDLDTPWEYLPEEVKRYILYGEEPPLFNRPENRRKFRNLRGFEGVVNLLQENYDQTESERRKDQLERYTVQMACRECGGSRLRIEARHVLIGGKNIFQITQMSIGSALEFFRNLKLTSQQQKIGRRILDEIRKRLKFLIDVGLDYLTLHRLTSTLSGGEAQRIRLATQIGSALTGVLYVLDEPSIGLHPRDTQRLLNTLKALRDLGNTVIVVEHDEETIRSADYLVDLGPGAGRNGGEVVISAHLRDALTQKNGASLTLKYLRGEKKIEIPSKRRAGNGKYLKLLGVTHNNLKNIDVTLPLGTFICVTGVSGSGKSSLISDTLYTQLALKLFGTKGAVGKVKKVEGLEHIDKVIMIDQSPIGRTPRSNPATYTDLFTPIRKIFAQLPEARARGYKPGRFSFNVEGGRCEKCEGAGVLRIEMHFLPDIFINCDECRGKRFNEDTLEIKYRGHSIADVLEMTVDEAAELFHAHSTIIRRLEILQRVGLGYIKLGQPATTLSGGEAQRVKLAKELSRRFTGDTLYILDEPTTGLHFADIAKLLDVLHFLVDKGNTVVVIEHNLDVIKTADWIIDLGPEGGERGGEVIATGTPEEIAACKESYTGKFLKQVLGRK